MNIIYFIYIYHIAYVLLYNFLSSLVSRRSSKFLLSREWKLCRETGTKVDVVTRHQYGIPGPGFHIISLGNQWWRPEMSAVFFGLRVILIFFFSNMSRMKRIRWLTNVMWSYRGWRKKVKSYLRIWRMKERPMTRSGQYHGNPLHKYHSWGRGGGVLDKVLYLLSPLQGPTPHPFIHHFWQKRRPLSYTFHWQMVLLSCTYFEFMQQEDRAEAKRTAKRWCWTNVKGLLLPCFVVNFT